MGWSTNKVMRIENGQVKITPNDLRFLLEHLGITDRARIDELVEAARLSGRRASWDPPGLTTPMRELIQDEVDALVIKQFAEGAVPGLLQTEEYARAVLAKWKHLSEPEIRTRAEARTRRRNQLLPRPERPDVSVLLDESALRRPVGGELVWRGQLADLLEYAKGEHFALRVTPLGKEMSLLMMGSFDILYFDPDRDEDDAVMYRESFDSDEIVENANQIREYRRYFDQMWDAALDEDASLRLISRLMEEVTPPE
jgi:hypothetical protein